MLKCRPALLCLAIALAASAGAEEATQPKLDEAATPAETEFINALSSLRVEPDQRVLLEADLRDVASGFAALEAAGEPAIGDVAAVLDGRQPSEWLGARLMAVGKDPRRLGQDELFVELKASDRLAHLGLDEVDQVRMLDATLALMTEIADEVRP